VVVVVGYVAFVEVLKGDAIVVAQRAQEQREEAGANQPDPLLLAPEEKARQGQECQQPDEPRRQVQERAQEDAC